MTWAWVLCKAVNKPSSLEDFDWASWCVSVPSVDAEKESKEIRLFACDAGEEMCRRGEKLKTPHRSQENFLCSWTGSFSVFLLISLVSVDWRATESETLSGASGLCVTQMLQIVWKPFPFIFLMEKMSLIFSRSKSRKHPYLFAKYSRV